MNEFLIFRPGVNETSKGEFLFDDAAASEVMAAYKQHGADVMIDLEHLSLDPDSPSFNPDAVGWCKLELRDGALWAVDVRWNTEGARRLSEKLQRYISPAFFTDENNRITELLNIALVAMPATHQLPALIAASKRRSDARVGVLSINIGKTPMPELLAAILKKLGLAENATPEECLHALDALMKPAEEKPAEEEGADEAPPTDEKEEMKALTRLHPQMQAKVLSWKVRAEKAEADKLSAEREAIIAANTALITPALETWARTIELSALRTFVAAAQPAAPPAREPEVAPALPTNDGLTPEDEEVIKLCGIDRAAYIETKKKVNK